jgi:ABC-type multidrug transport system ATPase subunit
MATQNYSSKTAERTNGQMDLELGKNQVQEKLELMWQHLSMTVDIPAKDAKPLSRATEEKQILFNVSGVVESGQVIAVLGPSGCGKTSLMNALSARVYKGKFEGEVFLNGEKRPNNWADLCAYIQQDDVLYEELTVKESLMFAGKMRMPRGTSLEVIEARAVELMNRLGLSHAANTLVGNSVKKGISGGERKRLIVATELFDRPRMIFLDEPTSGLDAASSLLLMKALHTLADEEGSIVITTIHQPRLDIFLAFDKVCLLAAGGKLIYFGSPAEAAEYWQKLGLAVPSGINPADHYVDTITITGFSEEERVAQRTNIDGMVEAWQRQAKPIVPTKLAHVDISRGGAIRPNFREQLGALTLRNAKIFMRDKSQWLSWVVQTIVIGFFLGLIFFNMTDDAGALMLRLLAFFFVIFVVMTVDVLPVVASFAMERRILVRERASNSYGIAPFYIAKLLLTFPMITISNIVIVVISYPMMGLVADVGRFFLYMLTVVVFAWVSQAVGLSIAAWTESPQTAASIAQVLCLVFIVFGGLMTGFMPIWINCKLRFI